MKNLTPMMRQYLEIKQNYQDAILFFRLGDFYEMFFEDAKKVSKVLNLVLTKRGEIPMCGVPHHASREYIRRLINEGFKVAICEQMEDEGSKSLIKREVVEVLTPGVLLDENFLEDDSNNYIVAISSYNNYDSLSFMDLSTSTLVLVIYKDNFLDNLKRDLEKYSPKEIIICEDFYYKMKDILFLDKYLVNKVPNWNLEKDLALKTLKEHFNVFSLSALGLKESEPYYISLSLILNYVKDNLKVYLKNIREFKIHYSQDFLILDETTQINLELVKNSKDFTKKYTLFETLNSCKTAMAKRLLKSYILNPLINREEINYRLNLVEYFYKNLNLLMKIRSHLSNVLDLERLEAKAAMKKLEKKDTEAIKNTLSAALELNLILNEANADFLLLNREEEQSINELFNLLENALSRDANELIKSSFNLKLKDLREREKGAASFLDAYLNEERRLSSLPNLKLKYNSLIGYFLESSNAKGKSIPDHFKLKQSLVNVKRYTTERLLEIEREVLSAKSNINLLELELFNEIKNVLEERSPLLKKLSLNLAFLDLICSFAQIALNRNYVKPILDNSKSIILENSRHPVVEKYMDFNTKFISNPVNLGEGDKFFFLITGPNMAGKSTYLRQVALIVLMAHIGSFVPASFAQIGIVDKIFCRIGASDNLTKGESTFLVEMNETANILRGLTESSLIIMDEVGRGTSTNDGLSIAWSVIEYILNNKSPRTLFATHYHELSAINHKNFQNISMKIEKSENKLTFLRKIEYKPSLNSYGVYVAKMAGLPSIVIERALSILNELTERERDFKNLISNKEGWQDLSPLSEATSDKSSFKDELYLKLKTILDSINVNELTPIKSLEILERIKVLFEE